MTQFVLAVPDRPQSSSNLEWRPIDDADDFLRDAAVAIFGHLHGVCIPQVRGYSSIDDLFTEAHNVVFNGGDFSGTHLSAVLPQILEACRSLAIWWSNDWSDLPVFNGIDVVAAEVARQLERDVGDVYLRWNRTL